MERISLSDKFALINEHWRPSEPVMLSFHYTACAPENYKFGTHSKSLGRKLVIKIAKPEDTPAAFQSAWNTHDMSALGSLFQEDATFVNRFGHYVRGKSEIVALHAPIHKTIYSDSTLENELIDVVDIADGAVVIHFWSRLASGAAHPAGPHEVDTLILAVLTRTNDAWLIRALENVTLVNPRTGETILRN